MSNQHDCPYWRNIRSQDYRHDECVDYDPHGEWCESDQAGRYHQPCPWEGKPSWEVDRDIKLFPFSLLPNGNP